tara:strand:- start:1809 stop:2534 length:726 start_codon:yes stop_codon:yes gene_type:complete
MSKVIVCTCDNTYKSYESYWNSVDFEFEFLSDRYPTGIEYDEQKVRDIFNFKGDVSKKHFWNSQGNRNIIWFYAHLRMTYYYMLNPNEDWYWFMDDDVICDNWSEFFKSFENNDADFISYYLFKNKGVKNQPNIPEIDKNTHSGTTWFSRFPGDGDNIDKSYELFGSFFPIVRFSNKSLKHLTDLLINNIHGYSEGFVPTQLNKDGFTLDTIFNNQSKSDHFDVNKIHILHKNIKVDWSWI